MKIVIAISTLLLCAVTLSSAVLFWTSMPTDTFGKALAGVTATALEACKYAFFPAGVYYLKKRNPGGLGLLLMGVILLCISVAAITGFLENAYNQHAQSAQQNTLEYQTKKQQLNSLQQQIDTLNNLIAADAAGSYRTRALDTSKKVKELEEIRNAALAELKTYRESPQGNAQSLFSALAIPIGASQDAVRQAAFMGLAIIVDICAISALLALGGMGRTNNTPARIKPDQQQEKTKTSMLEKAAQITPKSENKKPELTDREIGLSKKILAGVFGNPISVRNFIANSKVGYPTAKKVLDHLIDLNMVIRNGKQYELVQGVILSGESS